MLARKFALRNFETAGSPVTIDSGSWDRFLPVFFLAALFSYVLFAVASFLGSPVSEFDDAIPLVHGALVQQGRVPNLSFYSIYPPLGHYLYAAAYNLFGKSVISSRVIGALLYIAVLSLVTRFYRVQFPHWLLLLPACVLLVAVSIGASIDMASWPGFAFGLVALMTYLLAQTLSKSRLPALAVAGLLTAAAALYRVNFGGYVIVVFVFDLALRWWSDSEERWTRHGLSSLMWQALAFGVPFVLCCVSFCLWVYGSGASRAVSEFVLGAQKYMLLRGFIVLRCSSEMACFVMLPSAWFFFRILRGRRTLPAKAFVAAALAVANLLLVLACGSRPWIALIELGTEIASVLLLHLFIQKLETAELSILLFYCCQLHYYLSRADWSHSRWLLVVSSLLLAFLLFQRQEATASLVVESPPLMGTPFAVLLAAIVIASAAFDLRPRISLALNGVKLLAIRIHNPRVSDGDLVFDSKPSSPAWTTVYYDRDELAALRFLRSHTGHNEPIFVGVGDHSRVFSNDLRIYWLADRPIGARTFQLETRLATETPVQAEIIADLERNHVRWLILNRVPVRGDDTFAEQAYQGSALLDGYVRNSFRDVARFGPYAVLLRIENSASHR
jgi:hypothetical protein